ncbi:hypothetical protein MTBBW1_830039 [Desulfamplus magnetovallimortis]|uniref:Uncharacterized protein n=1 Tax=Desulfamplus magnetovallimortis TaxID=1246637 RepID=A0A1W1HKB9_9BACT|nr:hypothetical protein MTBBW1_830039 [Desulfamplus magnetovallimortis]
MKIERENKKHDHKYRFKNEPYNNASNDIRHYYNLPAMVLQIRKLSCTFSIIN